MLLNRKTVELLAPAGTWDAFTAAIDAGADAVYLGGKHFNMRVHNNDFNFDDSQLKQAVEYAHNHEVKLYITLNNLISEEELPTLKDYLKYLNKIKPDAILVQDFAVVRFVRELGINIPMHASIMMNTHNVHAIEELKKYGITRVVVSRELSLNEVKLLREQTGIETEYFIHGDMCIAESGQCIHSGVLFGQSGNRGRCLKPCRWSWSLQIEGDNTKKSDSKHRLALNDMCMYRHLPELINAGIYSFKIEGRMRPPEFIRRIVSTYRRAIDRYIADPTGYATDEADWQELYNNRVRDFTTVLAFSRMSANDIGWSGEREPKVFSRAVKEADIDDKSAAEIFDISVPINSDTNKKPRLSIRVATVESAKAALDNGADVVYVGGESFLPLKPWKLADYSDIICYAHSLNKKVILNTPRTTYNRECNELEQLFSKIEIFTDKPDGVMVSNLGSLKLLKQVSSLPIQTDLSFNLFNHETAAFLKDSGVVQAASSLELSYTQLKTLIDSSTLPIEVVIHGAYESMICDHNFVDLDCNLNEWTDFDRLAQHYVLVDDAGERHYIRVDQFGRSHIYFAKDLCLYKYLEYFMGASSLRIEAQLYSPEFTAYVTKVYRETINRTYSEETFKELQIKSPRPLGVGVYRFKQSRNS
ncbi:MAG: U32 family peptidase [Selenomonadaceae bacterium]|nr:U32 family peptidase [Selenomonadaceae bacterium]